MRAKKFKSNYPVHFFEVIFFLLSNELGGGIHTIPTPVHYYSELLNTLVLNYHPVPCGITAIQTRSNQNFELIADLRLDKMRSISTHCGIIFDALFMKYSIKIILDWVLRNCTVAHIRWYVYFHSNMHSHIMGLLHSHCESKSLTMIAHILSEWKLDEFEQSGKLLSKNAKKTKKGEKFGGT